MKEKIMSLFCNSCNISPQNRTLNTVEEMEEELNKRMYPKICIGHVLLGVAVVWVALMEIIMK